jgi:hypothetical protein
VYMRVFSLVACEFAVMELASERFELEKRSTYGFGLYFVGPWYCAPRSRF